LSAVRPGDLDGERLDLLGVGADPAEVDRLVEQVEPAFEMLVRERSFGVDQLMGPEGIAGVAGKAEQQPTQKSVNFGRCSDQSTRATLLNMGPRRSSWATSP